MNPLAQFAADVTGTASKTASNVAAQSQNQVLESLQTIVGYLWKVPGSLLILFVFYLLGKIIAGRITHALQQSKGETLAEDMVVFVNRFSVVAMLSIGLALVLQFIFQIDFIQVVGFFALGISFAFKDLLENLIAGAVIIIQNSLRIGDFISLGLSSGATKGKIKEIQTRQTIIKGIDGSAIIIPNSFLMSNSIINYTLHSTRRIEFMLNLDFDADLKKAIKIIYQVLHRKDHVLKRPLPQVLIKGMGVAVNLGIRFWIDSKNKPKSWLYIKSELYAEIKEALDKEGIAVAYPSYVYYDNARKVPAENLGKDVTHPLDLTPEKFIKRASHLVKKAAQADAKDVMDLKDAAPSTPSIPSTPSTLPQAPQSSESQPTPSVTAEVAVPPAV